MSDFGIIIQPTAGRTYEQLIADRDRGAAALLERGLQPIDTLLTEARYTQSREAQPHPEALALADQLRAMAQCTHACLVAGWEDDEKCVHLKEMALWLGLGFVVA